jgi:signal transduction histidine kinase
MRERALLIGGNLSIVNAPGGGTDVALTLPLTERP